MISSRRRSGGFTLIEIIFVIALVSLATVLTFVEKTNDLRVSQAKITGTLLYQYNNAVRSWLAQNIGAPYSVQNGTTWLKDTSCGGPNAIAFLPCSFPDGTIGSPLGFGYLALESTIVTTGTPPNQVTTVTTKTSPFQTAYGVIRSDLAGVATITAAAGATFSSTPVLMATDGVYQSDAATAVITMKASNNGSTDIWLRTDGSNNMHNNITFNPAKNANEREILNLSRISNIIGQTLFVGNPGGAMAGIPHNVIVDADQRTLGKMVIANAKGSSVALTIDSGSVDVKSGNVTASGNIEAGGDMQARRFIDADDNSFLLDPNQLSRLNQISTTGRIRAGEYIEIGGTASEGSSCSPGGLVGRTPSGQILYCESGVWKRMGAVQTIVRSLHNGYLGEYDFCALAYVSNLEDSHRCRVYKGAGRSWYGSTYKCGGSQVSCFTSQ